MGKEIVLGMIPPLLAFLAFLGANVTPLVVAALLFGALLFFAGKKGFSIQGGKKGFRVVERSSFSFDDIGGQERAKAELKEALDFLVHKEKVKEYGIRPLKGILLAGPPGTGKTLLAKAAANYTNSAFIAVAGSEFVEMYVGVGAQRIRDLFRQVKQLAEKNGQESGIIFIDEIDVLGGKREGSEHREYDQTLNQLLTEMDGISVADSPQILVIAATNRSDMLDPALLRPGRFDRQIAVDLPDKKGREQILKIHVKNKPLADDVDLERISRETFGFSGAQLESVANEAAIYALREGAETITQRHFSLAIDKVMMGETTDREATAEEKRRVALHELGHAIVSETLLPGSVSQVALRPRGQSLGYVRHNPQQDRYLYTKEYLEQRIMICLGGAAAEEIFFGTRSTGSKNDFEQALSLVHTLIDSGLSDLGIVKVDMLTKETLQAETKRILDALCQRTKELLQGKKRVFEAGLEVLLREELLGGDQFRKLLNETTSSLR
ncbi:AAA family ATPase [Bacillaceae bacterium]